MNRIKELCIRQGIEQKELALLTGVSQPTVSDWFNNKKNPRANHLDMLTNILGVSRAVIMGYDEITPASSAAVNSPAETVPLFSPAIEAVARASADLTPTEVQRVLDFIAGLKVARIP